MVQCSTFRSEATLEVTFEAMLEFSFDVRRKTLGHSMFLQTSRDFNPWLELDLL